LGRGLLPNAQPPPPPQKSPARPRKFFFLQRRPSRQPSFEKTAWREREKKKFPQLPGVFFFWRFLAAGIHNRRQTKRGCVVRGLPGGPVVQLFMPQTTTCPCEPPNLSGQLGREGRPRGVPGPRPNGAGFRPRELVFRRKAVLARRPPFFFRPPLKGVGAPFVPPFRIGQPRLLASLLDQTNKNRKGFKEAGFSVKPWSSFPATQDQTQPACSWRKKPKKKQKKKKELRFFKLLGTWFACRFGLQRAGDGRGWYPMRAGTTRAPVRLADHAVPPPRRESRPELGKCGSTWPTPLGEGLDTKRTGRIPGNRRPPFPRWA